jgi:hypothetical protein
VRERRDADPCRFAASPGDEQVAAGVGANGQQERQDEGAGREQRLCASQVRTQRPGKCDRTRQIDGECDEADDEDAANHSRRAFSRHGNRSSPHGMSNPSGV